MSDVRVFRAMLREEWRMHTELFGGRRFAAFPLFLAALGVATTWLLAEAGTDPSTVVSGTFVLAFLLGLQTGTVGFVGSQAMRDLLGGVTLLLFSARTLPLSQRRLLGIFLLKDVVYYAFLFMIPLSVATLPVQPTAQFVPLWISITLAFVLGLVVTVTAISLSTRGWTGRVVLLGGVVGLATVLAARVDLLAYTAYGFYRSPSIVTAGRAILPVLGLSILALWLFDTEYSSPSRTASNEFLALGNRLRTDDAVLLKTLLDVHRSSGGVWKLLFSAGLILAVGGFLVSLAGKITGVEPLWGVGLGAVLGLTAFSTYNWITQFDDVQSYFGLPIGPTDVFRSKGRAFVLLGFPIAACCYLVGVGWVGTTLLDGIVGAILLGGLQSYFFGLTVYVTGFNPNEFLFDVVLFAAFTVAVAVVLVPVLVLGFVAGTLTPLLAGSVVLAGLLVGGLGIVFYRRAVPRWSRRFRQA